MDIIVENSIKRISNNLEGFRRANNKYNFRCPFCGDSVKSKLKKRGWLFDYNNKVFFKCFNCDKSLEYSHFLKELFPEEYSLYVRDRAFGRGEEPTFKKEPTTIFKITQDEFENIDGIEHAISSNLAGKYLDKRQITNRENFYYTANYGRLLRNIGLKTYMHEYECNEPRLLIPHFNRGGYLAYIQMRCLNNSKIRYRTYKVIEDEYKLWNIDKVDLNKKIYVTEGALDASFIENAVAMSGSDAQLEKSILGNFKNNLRIILDNEPSSPVILQKYKTLIERGFKVFRWPNVKYKDINDCILGGYDICKDIYCDDNYFYGIQGRIKLACWGKF